MVFAENRVESKTKLQRQSEVARNWVQKQAAASMNRDKYTGQKMQLSIGKQILRYYERKLKKKLR